MNIMIYNVKVRFVITSMYYQKQYSTAFLDKANRFQLVKKNKHTHAHTKKNPTGILFVNKLLIFLYK